MNSKSKRLNKIDNKVNITKKNNFTPQNMTRERSRTKEILNKFDNKLKEDKNKEKSKREVYADRKGQVKLQQIKEAQKTKKQNIEEQKQAEIDNFSKVVIVQFASADGKKLGTTMSLETSANKIILNKLICKLKNDNENHIITINDSEITTDIKSTLIANLLREKKDIKSFNSEETIEIIYHPENTYSVKPMTRGGDSLEAHTDSILCCSFSPCGKFLASAGGDTTLRLWDMETFTLITTLDNSESKGHTSWVMNVSWSPCGEFLASGSLNGVIVIYNKKGNFVFKGKFHKDCITSLSWKPLHLSEQPILVTSGKDGNIRIFNVGTQQTILNIGCHNEAISKVIWSGENVIYTCSRDKNLKSWKENGELIEVYSGHGHWINTMSINTEFIIRTGFYDYENKQEGYGNKNSFLEEKNYQEKQKVALERYLSVKKKFEFKSIDRIVTGSDDYSMILWNPKESKKPISRMTGHNQLVNHVSFSPNLRFIASGSFDKGIKLWNGLTGAFICNFYGHVGSVYQLSWSADSKYLLSASKDSTVKLWNIKSEKETKSCRHNLPGHADEVYCIDWSPDGNCAASGSKDKRVNIWRH